MIHFDGVSKRYSSGQEALSHIDLDVAQGEMVFLTGHSGAGKSTLMKLIMLMERPTQGQVLIDGRNLNRLPRAQIAHHRRKVGVVFQNHQLLFDRSVFDNVALPLQIAGYPVGELGRRVRAALDKVGLLEKERQNPITLSGGEQQRVGIARAVVNKPTLLLADEPTGNLDTARATEIMQVLSDIRRERGITIVMVTHEANIAAFAERVLYFVDGKLVRDGTPQEVLR